MRFDVYVNDRHVGMVFENNERLARTAALLKFNLAVSDDLEVFAHTEEEE